MGIDDIGGFGAGEDFTDGGAVVEGVQLQRLEESSQADLPGPVAPDLGDDWVCG